MVVKIAIIKSGNIGTSPVIDLLLDERADRPNIDVRTFGSGAKMNPEQVEDVVPKIDAFEPDFAIFISPNPGAPGPAKARELLSEKDLPAIIIGPLHLANGAYGLNTVLNLKNSLANLALELSHLCILLLYSICIDQIFVRSR